MNLFKTERKTRRNGDAAEFTFRLCGPEDLEEILALQRHVKEQIPDSRIFVENTREELAESLALDCCIGAFSDGRLAAFSLSVANRATDRNLAKKLGCTDEELLKYVTYDTTFIHPAYRGFGLQKYFIPIKDEHARERGALYALCTVSPDNPHSLANVQASGFQIVRRAVLYGGVERLILKKAL